MLTTVYGKAGCIQCKFTSKLLERRGVPFDYVDITINPIAEEHVKSLGYSNLPVVVTNSGHWSGFKPDRLERI